jgi:hypothetical protein
VTTPPGSTSTFSTADGSLPAGGPDSVQTLPVGDIDIVLDPPRREVSVPSPPSLRSA